MIIFDFPKVITRNHLLKKEDHSRRVEVDCFMIDTSDYLIIFEYGMESTICYLITDHLTSFNRFK